ncbi:MAG: hypothetical protein O3A95_09980 [Planctomycetota bacterium]|nr:hypothetical protein [Planctomycetota bacterium]MDA1114611.1 hypothetical protein [Planctomycetota bacterium]
MVGSTSGATPQLRDAVTTPAGCTISALLRLEDGGLRSTGSTLAQPKLREQG